MSNGQIFKINIVVPGEDEEKAWEDFQANPSKYLPEKMSDRIVVTGADCTLKAVQTYGEPPELAKYQLRYAEHFGWSQNERGWWIKADQEEDPEDPRCSIIAWGRGWAPRHSASGLLDNAAWGDLRAAIRTADEMFFDKVHFKPKHGLCAGCFTDVPFGEWFSFEGEIFCSTGCT